MKEHVDAIGRLRVQALVILLVVFVIGVASGLAIGRAAGPHGGPPRQEPPREGPPPGRMQGLPPALRERLDLTPDQERRIEAALEGNRARTDAVLDEYLPRLRALTDSLRVEVRAELTPAQQATFDKLEKERPPRDGRDGRGPRGPHGPPPGEGPPPPGPPR